MNVCQTHCLTMTVIQMRRVQIQMVLFPAVVTQVIPETAPVVLTLMSAQQTRIVAIPMPPAKIMMEVSLVPVTQAIKEMALTARM